MLWNFDMGSDLSFNDLHKRFEYVDNMNFSIFNIEIIYFLGFGKKVKPWDFFRQKSHCIENIFAQIVYQRVQLVGSWAINENKRNVLGTNNEIRNLPSL